MSYVLNKDPDDEVELAVDLAYFFRMGGVLPRTGGLLDQDNYHIMLIRAGLRAMAKKEEQDNKKAEAKSKMKGR